MATATPVPRATALVNSTPILEIAQVDVETLIIPVIGTSPLICHNWSAKAKLQMLRAQQGVKAMKEPRVPEEEYKESFYHMKDGGYGFPSIAFKSATVDASRYYGKTVTKVGLRQFLFFQGELSPTYTQALYPITGEPRMREDMVTVGISGTDLRFRAEFPEWSSRLTVTYVRSCLTRESVLALIGAGGLGVGTGDWRPEKGGDFGTYRIDPTVDVVVVND